jgi:hypothetical protein
LWGQGATPQSTSEEVEIPMTSEEFLFLVIVFVFLGEYIEDGFSSVGWI